MDALPVENACITSTYDGTSLLLRTALIGDERFGGPPIALQRMDDSQFLHQPNRCKEQLLLDFGGILFSALILFLMKRRIITGVLLAKRNNRGELSLCLQQRRPDTTWYDSENTTDDG